MPPRSEGITTLPQSRAGRYTRLMRAWTQRLTLIPIGLIAALAILFAPATDDAQPLIGHELTPSSTDGTIGARVLAPTFDHGLVTRQTIHLDQRHVRATLLSVSHAAESSAQLLAAGLSAIVVAGAAAESTAFSQKPRVSRGPPN